MDAKRWSPLWVFVGGCLTGAALIGWHSRGGPESASDAHRDVAPRSLKADSVEERVLVEPAATEVMARGQSAASDTAERDKVEPGNSVAEVLARLETEYREQSAPPAEASPAPAPAEASPASDVPMPASPRELAHAQAPSAVSVAGNQKLVASEPPAVVRAVAPAAEAPASDARVATLSADDKPTPPVAEEATRLASIRDEQAKALERGQEQLAQMQQLAALQQATLVEQYTLFQLQLLSQSPAPRATVITVPTRSQRRGQGQGRGQARGGRIVASLPSSISATDNPWGFDMQPSELVR